MHGSPWPSENPAPAGRHYRWKPGIDWQLVLIVVALVGVVFGLASGMTYVVGGVTEVLEQIGTALTGATA